jgi:hypothetical protein
MRTLEPGHSVTLPHAGCVDPAVIQGSLDNPAELLALLRWLLELRLGGRLCIQDENSYDIFLVGGRMVDVVAERERGVAALEASLRSPTAKRFTLQHWELSPGVMLEFDEALAHITDRTWMRQVEPVPMSPVGSATDMHQHMTALANEVSGRGHRPVDSLEVAALLESMGITDQIARQKYATDDVFELGETVLSLLNRPRGDGST